MNKKCSCCGIEYKTYHSTQKFCSYDCANKAKIKFNDIIEHNNFAEIIIDSKTYGKKLIKIDKDDIEKVKKYSWFVSQSKQGVFYVMTSSGAKRLHRYIMDCPKGLVIDHINHDTFDNRKRNLRICTVDENCKNTKWYKNNKTGEKYISFNKKGKSYIISRTVNKKSVYIGSAKTLKEAIEIRDRHLQVV